MYNVIAKDGSFQKLEWEDAKDAFRHTASHVLAQAVKNLFPDAKLAIGPAIENGFYYDFDASPFSAGDLAEIEKEMKKIVKQDCVMERFELPRDQALKLMEQAGEIYKVELINDLPEQEVISFYRQGDFVDLCAGPHLTRTGKIAAFKLLSSTGAYWKGSEKNKMLQRIYATAFPKKSQLDQYIEQLEEAKKRDHNKLGRQLGIFTTSDVVGQGLPLLMPKGAKILQILQRFVEDEEERRGYLLTKTPVMAKNKLFEISGHWDHYRDGMFWWGEDEVLCLRPMTCPFQYIIYNSELHSYRDLPIRYAETASLYRNEASGEMHGLIRIRQFTLSDGHIICTPEQLADEFKGCVDLINYFMKCLGIESDITYRFSKWDPDNTEKYINDPSAWDDAQSKMKTILDQIGLNYTEAVGEAAFYGPKLDIQFKNVHGKEDTLFTVQIDFAIAQRFGMVYMDADGQKKTPFIIHRSAIGCYERTLAMLIEKYAGAFPTWLAPLQVRILPIGDQQLDYAKQLEQKLRSIGARVEVDARSEKIGYKIRAAQTEKIPYMLVVGDKEVASEQVAVRTRKDGDKGAMPVEQFIQMFADDISLYTTNRKDFPSCMESIV